MNRRDTDWKSLCKLQLENYKVTGGLDPSKWASARPLREVAEKLGVEEDFLQELADLGVVPHFRFRDELRFPLQVLSAWIGDNLVETVPGKFLPMYDVVPLELPVPERYKLPPELRGVRGITDATPMCQWPGIYFLTDADEVVYVGQAMNVAKRCGMHEEKEFSYAYAVPCHPEALTRAEKEYIRSLIPRYNRCPVANKARAEYERQLNDE